MIKKVLSFITYFVLITSMLAINFICCLYCLGWRNNEVDDVIQYIGRSINSL